MALGRRIGRCGCAHRGDPPDVVPAARALPSRYLESRPTKQPAIRKAGHRIQDRRLDVTGHSPECLAGRLDVGLDRDRERYRYRLDVYLSSLVILT